MKYVGPAKYKAHVLGDIKAALRDLRAKGYKADKEPSIVTVQDVRGTRKVDGEWATKHREWGVAWHYYTGGGKCRIEMIVSPTGQANKRWRKTLRHEAMHAAMCTNGIATKNYGDPHNLMKSKFKGWY